LDSRRADLGVIVLVKALACALAIAVGFRAVSDDDFARVTIAQSFARSPVFDASGTSWLPFPFWVTGSAMLVAGRSLFVARAVAFALGLASAAIVGVAASRLTGHRRGALLGGVFAAVFPWSVRLGVATVPELLTAAFAVLALASLADTSARFRCLGGAALLCATLSRYDVWPIAAAFAAWTFVDFFRWEKPSVRQRFFLGAAIVLALAGPSIWIAWNHVARGNAFDFLDRVAAYRRALGTPDDAPVARFFAYPIAMLRHEPEIFGALGILLVVGQAASLRPYAREAWRPYRRPLCVALFQMALLSAAMIKDGAPTHHPERALLVMLLLCALLVGNLAAILLPRMNRLLRSVSAAAALGVLLLSLIIVRRWYRGEDFTVRQDEVATGGFARGVLPAGERILVDVADYGYFAFIAALGRPEDAVLDRDLDPRKSKQASSFEDRAALLRKIDETRVRWIVAVVTSPGVKTFGPPQFVHGNFGVWRVWPEESGK
jgi:hypothetical protein